MITMNIKNNTNTNKFLFFIAVVSLIILLVFSLTQLAHKNKYSKLYEVNHSNKKIGQYKNENIKIKDKVIIRHYPKTKHKLLNEIIEQTQKSNLNNQSMEIKQDYEIKLIYDRYIIINLFDLEDGVEKIQGFINYDTKKNELITFKNLFNEKAIRYLEYLKLKEEKMQLMENNILIDNFLIAESELQKYIKNDYGSIQAGSAQLLPSVYLEHDIDTNKKLIAITFDDGPHLINTEEIIKISKKYEAHVTFFVVGLNVADYPEIIKKSLDEGHQIASHSYSHKNLTTISDDEINFQLNHTNELLNEVTGNDIKWMIRPPYGAYNQNILNNFPYTYVNWTVDTNDWLHKDPQIICDAIVSSAFDGSIVLLHDIYESSVKGFECGIKRLSEEGYQFVTVQDMFKAKNIELEKGKLYRSATK